MDINVPQDRESSFEPRIVKKRQKDISSIDDIHFSVRDNHVIKKLAAYVVLGINQDGRKEVLCADGLKGIKESINVAFPYTEYQRCIVHQVRNTLKYVAKQVS